MFEGNRSRFARLLGGAALGALAAGALVPATSVGAATDVEVDRLAGDDRFETAAIVANAGFASGATDVILVNGQAFSDALAGSALAGTVDAPVLLTEADALPAATSGAIEGLGVGTVHILGGTAAVSSSVESALEADGLDVVRIAGDDRYGTAAAVAERIGAGGVAAHDGLATALIATGSDFADALAGGPLAAGGADGVHPILLVNDVVPTSTADAIDALGIEQVIILGGTGAVSSSVEDELERITGNEAIRFAGSDRYATAVDVAEAAISDFGFSVSEVLLASGTGFADALAGGPLGAVRSAPIVLTPQASLSGETESFLQDHATHVEKLTVLGGNAAVSEQAVQDAEGAAESTNVAGLNETIPVDPANAENVPIGQTRTFTATGMGTSPVDIVLIECGDVRRTADGNTVFANRDGNGVIDRSAQVGDEANKAAVDNVSISSVNGTPRSTTEPTVKNNDYVDDVPPQDGSVSFVVSGPFRTSSATVCAVPVLFVDVNGDDALNGGGTDPTAPTEQFGTGGRTTWSPGVAAAGQFDHNVDTVTNASDRFTACKIEEEDERNNELVNRASCQSFLYDASDTFQLEGSVVDLTTWEAALSVDDDVSGTYQPGGNSVFNLLDEGPRAVASVQAVPTSSGVTIGFIESQTPSTDTYRLYRVATSDACPSFSQQVYGTPLTEVPDTNAGRADNRPHLITDGAAESGVRYCYIIVAVDDLDEGIPSAPASATRQAMTQVPPTTPPGDAS